MKIYLFCLETGVYQGEDFTDVPSMKNERQELSSGATIIPPPPYETGFVPVFNVRENCWKVRRIGEVQSGRTVLTE